jgi:hypothetical protein
MCFNTCVSHGFAKHHCYTSCRNLNQSPLYRGVPTTVFLKKIPLSDQNVRASKPCVSHDTLTCVSHDTKTCVSVGLKTCDSCDIKPCVSHVFENVCFTRFCKTPLLHFLSKPQPITTIPRCPHDFFLKEDTTERSKRTSE